MRHTTEVLMEQLFNSEIEKEDFVDAQNVVQNTVSYLAESPECFDLIDTLNTHADFVYAHSLASVAGVLVLFSPHIPLSVPLLQLLMPRFVYRRAASARQLFVPADLRLKIQAA